MAGETHDDIENVEAWAVIIEHMLYHVPAERRAEVLALAVENEAAERAKDEADGGFRVLDAAEMHNMDRPGLREWHTIMRLKALLVQVFVRNITNNHGPKEAAALLFVQHRYGTGSGALQDYLRNLPVQFVEEEPSC